PQVGAALTPEAPKERETVVVASDLQGKPMLSATAAIPRLGWHVFVELPLAEARAPLWKSLDQSLAILGVGFVFAVVAGFLLARRMVVPIRTLETGAARIGAGDLAHRIEIKSRGDELARMADEFNRMAGQLQESHASLERKVEERTHELQMSLEQQT